MSKIFEEGKLLQKFHQSSFQFKMCNDTFWKTYKSFEFLWTHFSLLFSSAFHSKWVTLCSVTNHSQDLKKHSLKNDFIQWVISYPFFHFLWELANKSKHPRKLWAPCWPIFLGSQDRKWKIWIWENKLGVRRVQTCDWIQRAVLQGDGTMSVVFLEPIYSWEHP